MYFSNTLKILGEKTYLNTRGMILRFASKSCYFVVVADKERFDSTIGIPTNLEDGIYIVNGNVSWKWLFSLLKYHQLSDRRRAINI